MEAQRTPEVPGARQFQAGGEAYDRFMGRYSQALEQQLADFADVREGVTLLDVGCGPGAFTAAALRRLSIDSVIAVDPSQPFVEACRKRFPGLDVRLGRAEELPVASASVDRAVAQSWRGCGRRPASSTYARRGSRCEPPTPASTSCGTPCSASDRRAAGWCGSRPNDRHGSATGSSPGSVTHRAPSSSVPWPGRPRHRAERVTALRRTVDWNGPPGGVDYARLPAEVAARLKTQRDVVDLTQQLDQLRTFLQVARDVPEQVIPAEPVVLPDATDELAERLHVGRDWLQECIDLLNDRSQLILYGPPGTGKTYLAQEIAQHVAGDNYKLVQFHPAYSYEDFFEGYRPVGKADGGIGFELRAGPLRALVDQASENPTTPYVLIIDEINRGNLAKIFGELYFLLEYRDRGIDLLYASGSDKDFTFPKNVYLIGTMNTADRSIALVDAAMRRRFAFVALHPSEEPTSGLLRRWLTANDRDPAPADLLEELNTRIEDPDFKIGPSYLMRPAVYADGGLDRVWRTAILPLLAEHHYGEQIDVPARYGLPAIRAAVARRKAADDAPPEPA